MLILLKYIYKKNTKLKTIAIKKISTQIFSGPTQEHLNTSLISSHKTFHLRSISRPHTSNNNRTKSCWVFGQHNIHTGMQNLSATKF